MPDPRAWNAIWELNHRQVDLGQPFALTDEVRALLRGTAPDVAIAERDVEQALQSEPSAAKLLEEIARRIREGSHRLSRAISAQERHRSAGDVEAARKVLLELLDVEVVPHYRDIAQTYLDVLDEEA